MGDSITLAEVTAALSGKIPTGKELDKVTVGTTEITATANYTITEATVAIVVTLKDKVTYVTLTYVLNGGTYEGNDTVAPVQVVAGSSVSGNAITPIRDGFTFDGWYSDEAFETPFDFDSATINTDTTVYAKWTAVEESDREVVSYAYDFNGSSDTLTYTTMADFFAGVAGSATGNSATVVTTAGTIATASGNDIRWGNNHLKLCTTNAKFMVETTVQTGDYIYVIVSGKTGSNGTDAVMSVTPTGISDTASTVLFAGADNYVTKQLAFEATADGNVVITLSRDSSSSANVQVQTLQVVVVPAHTHTSDETLQHDESGHWYGCTYEGCLEKVNFVAHDENAEWVITDETNHYRVCETCVQQYDIGAHEYGEWVLDKTAETRTQTCEVCGKQVVESVTIYTVTIKNTDGIDSTIYGTYDIMAGEIPTIDDLDAAIAEVLNSVNKTAIGYTITQGNQTADNELNAINSDTTIYVILADKVELSPAIISFENVTTGDYTTSSSALDVNAIVSDSSNILSNVEVPLSSSSFTIEARENTVTTYDGSEIKLNQCFYTNGSSYTTRRCIKFDLAKGTYTINVWALSTSDNRAVGYYDGVNGSTQSFATLDSVLTKNIVEKKTITVNVGEAGATYYIGGTASIRIYYIEVIPE